MDDEDYKKGLALCLNYIPCQEGSLRGRSGFRRLGNTKNNEPGKLMPFRFTIEAPYVSEFTDGNLRLWSNGLQILDTATASVISVTGSTPTFTLRDLIAGATGVPKSWNTGDSILVRYTGTDDMEAAPHLANREFILHIVSRSAGTVTLSDALTGSPLTGALTFTSDKPIFVRILDIPTTYQYPGAIRQVENSAQTVNQTVGGATITVSQPDYKVTYLYPMVMPQSLTYQTAIVTPPDNLNARINSNMALQPESFVDGPYLDSNGTSIPLAVDTTTGTITVTIHGYDATTTYKKGELVVTYPGGNPFYYVSLVDANKGNALPGTTPFVNASWFQVNVNENNWNSGQTYILGAHVVSDPYNAKGVGTLYYSKIASNTNHDPVSSPTQWGLVPPTWDALLTYTAGAFVVDSAINYLAIGVPVMGTPPASDTTNWMVAPDMATAVDTFMNQITGWLSGPLFYVDDAGGTDSTIGVHFGTNNPGRCIRLKWGPQPWDSKFTYATDDLVNFNDVIFKSLINSNTGNYPDEDAVSWEIQTTTILWTWGRISDASDHMLVAKIDLIGPDLPTNTPIWEFRMGVYSDTTGWPKCGTYHEGRLWLAGEIPNRLDAGSSNQGFNFTPTAPDGTVSDANGISITLNSAKVETIEALSSITEGIIILSSEAEWLVSASALNDPITPTSVQAHRTTAWSAHPDEATRLPAAVAAIQRGGRRVMEYRTFIDMTAYQSRLNASDLTRRCQHLTAGGVGQTAYQSLSQPIVWVAPSNKVTMTWQPSYKAICSINIISPVVVDAFSFSDLFGIGYMRSPDATYTAPFSFEHGKTYISGVHQDVYSCAVQRAWQPGQENVYILINDLNDGNYYVEMMEPIFESSPLYDVFPQYGTLSKSFMVDSGVSPTGCKISTDGLSCTFYGMWPLAGKTVSFTILGKYVGDFLIAADGTCQITFNSTFTMLNVGHAMTNEPSDVADGGLNENSTPASFQQFRLDSNGHSIPSQGDQNFLGQFGYKFRRRGQMNRPLVGGANGPTFAKINQNSRAGIYVDACNQIKGGTDFSNLVNIKITKNGVKDVRPVDPGEHVTGVFRDFIPDGNTFDGRICWEQTDPVPGNILAVGGFNAVEDT